jgi:hypothetical protein
MLLSLFVVLGFAPARADEDKDIRHQREDNDKGIRSEIVALQAQVTSLQSTVFALQTGNATLRNEIDNLQASNTALKSQLAAVQSNPALALGPFVSIDPNGELDVAGPNIIFSGANVHIVNGSGSTYNPNGLGNLIIGYNEFPNDGGPSGPHLRMGSHNLVIGDGHRYNASGGLIAGELNTINGQAATVTGGSGNIASSRFASVSGGADNCACGEDASVSGGGSNIASDISSVSGGVNNTANGPFAMVSGGESNTASGLGASVSGGARNNAGGRDTVVIGGQNVIDENDLTIQPKAPFP